MKYLILIMLLQFSSNAIAENTLLKWKAYGSLGLLLNTYDPLVESLWAHQAFESPTFKAGIYYSYFFSKDRFQLIYGGGLEQIQSVEKIGSSSIETTGQVLTLESGLLWRPFSGGPFGFGHTLEFTLADDIQSVLKTSGFNQDLRDKNSSIFSGALVSPLISNNLWFLFRVNDRWELFTQFKVRGFFTNTSQTLGVTYDF